MKRKPVFTDPGQFPDSLRPLVETHRLYDSSCSQDARVWFLEGRDNLFLKTGPAGSLKQESVVTRFYHGIKLGPEVLGYFSGERDWLLTTALPGEDCTFHEYQADPRRLCDTTASLLRQLHDTPHEGCPVPDHRKGYLDAIIRNHAAGFCDLQLFPEKDWGFSSSQEAWKIVEAQSKYFQNDTLLHGDYCLPNILLDNWNFSGFIDVGRGGVGDRHIDIFWGVWTLFFNLKTNAYYDRFLDVYGRDRIEPEMLRLVAACEIFG